VRSGFATVVGRANVGKSTLVNRILGTKVSIVSDKPGTTRTAVRGVVNRPGAQLVLVDTPGMHRPRNALGERLNATVGGVLVDVDVAVVVVDATAPVGRGDRAVAARVAAANPPAVVVVVNKVDAATRAEVVAQLAAAAELGFGDRAEYWPVSALTGEGVDGLVDCLFGLLPEGPAWFPEGVVTDVPEAFFVAELVREQLLAVVRDELPHSIACRVTEWEWPRIRCEIVVERPSQKGIVIGRRGSVLKAVGTAVREQLPAGAYLELVVKVERDWQRRPGAVARLGY
jgi:GTP-binding protein Era